MDAATRILKDGETEYFTLITRKKEWRGKREMSVGDMRRMEQERGDTIKECERGWRTVINEKVACLRGLPAWGNQTVEMTDTRPLKNKSKWSSSWTVRTNADVLSFRSKCWLAKQWFASNHKENTNPWAVQGGCHLLLSNDVSETKRCSCSLSV